MNNEDIILLTKKYSIAMFEFTEGKMTHEKFLTLLNSIINFTTALIASYSHKSSKTESEILEILNYGIKEKLNYLEKVKTNE